MQIHLANRRYSSWSLRGWLAARHCGLPVEEVWVDIYSDDWERLKRSVEPYATSLKAPVLVDGGATVWNSMAIIQWLDEKSGGGRFWPQKGAARAFALSIATEMQASFMALRKHCPMNCMRHYPGWALEAEALPDVARIAALWERGIESFSGPWLAGAEWGGADIMFAPIVSRFTTYDVKLPPVAEAYRQRAIAHPLVAEWVASAQTETVIKPAYEY